MTSTRTRLSRLAVSMALIGGSLGLTTMVGAAPAQADTNCSYSSHSHYHFPYAHSDYYHNHGQTVTNYREWVVHNHGDVLFKYCP